MKLTVQQKRDIEVLLYHSRRDISYGDGGTFTKMNGDLDQIAIRQVKRSHDLLKQIIAKGL